MYPRVSAPPTSTTPPTPSTTSSAKELTVRIDPSDIMFSVLALTLLLAAGFVLGGLAAHPFAG